MRPRDDYSRKRSRDGEVSAPSLDQVGERAPRDRKLSRSISDLGWRTFRTFLAGKAEKYGRDFRVISVDIRALRLRRMSTHPQKITSV